MSEITDDEIDAAVDESLEAIEPIIDDAITHDEIVDDVRDCVEIRLRHAAGLAGGYLRGEWVSEDDEKRYVVVEGEREREITVEVLQDVGMSWEDASIFTGLVHQVFSVAAGDLDREIGDSQMVVVPVPASMRDVLVDKTGGQGE